MTRFSALATLEDRFGRGEFDDEIVDGTVVAALEVALNVLPAADAAMLSGGAGYAKRCGDMLSRRDEDVERSPGYLAGRLHTLADLLALAAQRCVGPDFERVVRQAKYADILRVLAGQRLRNVEIASQTGSDVATVSRKLKELKEIGAVVANTFGRDKVNALTPAADVIARDLGRVRPLAGIGNDPGRIFENVRARKGNSRTQVNPPSLSATFAEAS